MRARRLGQTGVVLLVLTLLMGIGWVQATAADDPQPSTVVSLTFDDGAADQMTAVGILAQYQLAGTFYIITGAVDTTGYLTKEELRQVAAGGNEIGGHTVSHLDLTKVPAAEAHRQICASRSTLSNWGYQATSFAYPDGSYTPATESLVKQCGYSNARSAAGLRSAGCSDCASAESRPPADPYAIRAPSQVDTSWTLATLKQTVLAAQRDGGGWVPLVFHHICATATGCGDLAISADTFRAFANWLANDAGSDIGVRTVGDVAGGANRPLANWSPAQPHGVVNGSLDALGSSGGVNAANETATVVGDVPQCWMKGGYGTNVTTWRRVPGVHGGQHAEQLAITSYTNGDAKLLPQFDLGNCSIPVHEGASYRLSAWYTSTARTQFDVYYRDPDGRWVFWLSSRYFAPTGTWTNASWQTPRLPAGASGLSFGLALFSVGTLTTDDYAIQSATPAPPAATASRPPVLSLLTLPFIGAVIILIGVYVLSVRRSIRKRRRDHMARASRDEESRVSSSNR